MVAVSMEIMHCKLPKLGRDIPGSVLVVSCLWDYGFLGGQPKARHTLASYWIRLRQSCLISDGHHDFGHWLGEVVEK